MTTDTLILDTKWVCSPSRLLSPLRETPLPKKKAQLTKNHQLQLGDAFRFNFGPGFFVFSEFGVAAAAGALKLVSTHAQYVYLESV